VLFVVHCEVAGANVALQLTIFAKNFGKRKVESIDLSQKVSDTLHMVSNTFNAVRDFLLRAVDGLQGTTATGIEAFHIALELLVWAKLSYALRLPSEARIGTAITGDLERALQSLLTVSKKESLDETFATVTKLRGVNPSEVNRLLQLAETLAASGSLERPSVDDLMPTAITGSIVSTVLPTELGELITHLGELSPDVAVYTPWDFFGHLATLSSQAGAFAYLETPIRSEIPRLVQILTSANTEIHYTDPIVEPSAMNGEFLRKFDVSLAFPPIGARYEKSMVEADRFGRFPEKTGVGAVLAVRHLLSQTRRRIVVAVPNSLLFSSGTEQLLRKDLLQRGVLHCVIAIPEGLLESTSSGFAILVLDPSGGRQHVRFVDASAAQFHEQISKSQTKLKNVQELARLALHTAKCGDQDSGDESVAATIAISDLYHSDLNLQVNRHVLPESKKRVLQKLRETRTLSLRDVITTVRPLPPAMLKASTGAQAATSEIFEVGALDLPAFGFVSHAGRRIELPSSKLKEHAIQFLRPFDIVLIVKGSVGKVGIVSEVVPDAGPGGWVVGQSGIVLRSNYLQHFDPMALFMFLRSPLGQMLLARIVSGATTPLIQLRELLSLQIPDLTAEEQLHAIEALAREREIQDQLDKLRDEQAAVAANLWRLQ